jgi:cell division protein ZipA
MPELRWILIGFAIVLLAGIYLWGRKASVEAAKREASLRARPEPGMFSNDVPQHESDTAADIDPSDWDSGDANRANISEAWREPTSTDAPTIERHVQDDSWRGRMEPTFSEPFVTEELPIAPEAPRASENVSSSSTAPSAAAPTLSSGDSPPPKRIERRKILALRLAASPHRIEGARLSAALEAEALQHGKYAVYHRLHEDGLSIFSVASIVEPGTFDPETMAQTQYPGITLFAQLPGPVPGMHALNELVACARRLQQTLGGTLQDDRGVPLTVHRIERLRQEVREFERPPQSAARGGTVPSTRL